MIEVGEEDGRCGDVARRGLQEGKLVEAEDRRGRDQTLAGMATLLALSCRAGGKQRCVLAPTTAPTRARRSALTARRPRICRGTVVLRILGVTSYGACIS